MPAKVNSTTDATAAAGTSVTLTKPSGLSVGDLLLWILGSSTAGPATPSTPAGWSVAEAWFVTSTSPNSGMVVWYRIVDGTEGASFTKSGLTSGRWSSIMIAYDAVDQTTPFDTADVQTINNSGTPVHGSITTVNPNALVIGIENNTIPTGSTPTWASSNLTIDEQALSTAAAATNSALAIGSVTKVAPGAITPVLTVTGATPPRGVSLSMVLRPASTTATRSTSDTAAATDAVARQLALPRGTADTAAATDAQARQLTQARSGSDSAAASDACAYQITRARTAADSAPAADTSSRLLAQARASADSAPAIDTDARSSTRARAVADSAPASDVDASSVNPGRSMADTAAAADTTSRSLVQARARNDAAPATDTAARSSTRSRSQADTAPATDTTARAMPQTRTTTDTALAADATAASLVMLRLLVESAPSADATAPSFTPGGGGVVGPPAQLTTSHARIGRIDTSTDVHVTTDHHTAGRFEVSNA